MHHRRETGQRERGQVLALFVFGFMAFVAAVALVLDGGNAYAHQRISQNGSDAAAEAGAIVLGEQRVGRSTTDQQVLDAVNGMLTAMEMDVANSSAVYTDIDGNHIGRRVGSLGGSAPPANAWGVEVTGNLPFNTLFARLLGMDRWTAVTDATAIAGYSTNANGPFLPFTPPVDVVMDCLNDGAPEWAPPRADGTSDWIKGETYVIPLCSSGPGNVGWLDFDPPSGGTSTLIDNIYPAPANPPSIDLPSWQWMVEPGDSAAGGIEDALRQYNGWTVLIPLYDATCDVMPSGPDDDCPADPGHGTNQVYHFPTLAAFQLCGVDDVTKEPLDFCVGISAGSDGAVDTYEHGSYMSGANVTKACNMNKPGTGCLVGRFMDFFSSGNATDILVGEPSPSKVVSVQLIK